MAFSQVLVPIDYSEPSNAALQMAARLVHAFQGRLLVLHLMPLEIFGLVDRPFFGDGQHLAEESERLRRHVREVLADVDPLPAFEAEATWGSPYLQIVQMAIDRRVDLIVMGTHGRTGLKHVLLGSVAEKTVRLAPCPVLTVRAAPGRAADAASARRDGEERPTRPVTVGTMMHASPLAIEPDATLATAHTRMTEGGVRHLPVVEGGKLVGILSERDLPAHAGRFELTSVRQAMTPDPISVSREVSVEAAACLMLERRVRALPVVDGERIVGMLSETDILEDYVRAART